MVTLGIAIYVVFSWWTWWYGGSFGSRPMIDYYGLMAFPMAALIQKLAETKWWIRIVTTTVFVFFIYLNQFQMSQYRTSLLHWDTIRII